MSSGWLWIDFVCIPQACCCKDPEELAEQQQQLKVRPEPNVLSGILFLTFWYTQLPLTLSRLRMKAAVRFGAVSVIFKTVRFGSVFFC